MKKMHGKDLDDINGKLNNIANQMRTLKAFKVDALILQSLSKSDKALKKAQMKNNFPEVIIAQI